MGRRFFLKKDFTWVFLIILGAIGILFLPWFWRSLYPLPYRDTIFSNAQKAGLDPYLVMAVIRVESKFRPQAQSIKGAKGLMQLMPETARWVSERTGEKFEETLLFDVHYNTKIGCWYLAFLIDDFEGNIHLALAAYNGGPGNVKQWLKDGVWDGNPAGLEKIPFLETRQFVERVLNDHDTYKRIYGWYTKFAKKEVFSTK